ncbi:hypothetical protein PC118_g14778 [Phytophthora cactorum]|uniref:Uncharacterized protein n=1 Tax=Phytophthora cactorum TaxID=29920 RepID=A0A329S031_9STRA|nr:hypothetical protein PC118_g14778 [Phytophthora cactorum]KAG3004103.1 hypothetical protein PC119_g15709 [Phytophthora cactorum]KAG3053604.1 hypothetical protein PC121_g16709 [Phytophthora cactorum]KAG3074000.1 hypothetical protein PC122_g14579 [Phytophthora cactorum]RAW29216.1 hypothetical protein PC110_g14425 [Phytophthora cactorum]
MNLPSSPKEAFGELPQLLLERSENDDDFGDSNPNSGKLNTPNYAREAAASSVSRWQWKFWKKSSPSSPKQQRHKQRKHPLPGKILAPLPVSSSPGRHNVEKLDRFIASIAEHHSLPIKPRSAESNCIGSPLPPLEQQILQRPRLVLGINGTPTVAMEQIVRLQEYNEPNPPVNALQLASIPKKCLGGDEIALMPCHSLHHRGYELLSAELWREPVRDRNKNWLQDELPTLVKGTLHAIPWSMTKAPGPSNRGKWARFENYKLHIPLNSTTTILDTHPSPISPLKRPQRVFLRAQGVLISRSYCLVSVFGEGIYGRLYGAGLTGKDKKRCLRVEAYEPATSRTYSLIVTLQDIELIFRVGGDDPEREALLAPGKKQELLRQLIALLYFEYPDESNNGDDSFAREVTVTNPKTKIQVLKISPEIQLNESTLRRLEREERLRQDEAQRLEELAAILGKPRRARHRVLCQTIKLRGRHFYVSIYHFPAQARNLIITAYNPSSSITYRLTIGLLEAASLVKLYPYPRSGFSPEQTMLVAQGLLPRLQILGREDSRPNARMILAINGGRKGPGMTALPPLAPIMTAELKRDGLFNKMLQDSQRSLQLELEMTQLRLHNDAEAERVEIRQKITNLETKRAEMNEKDQGHSIRIEEIDATGGGGANAEVKRLHEERRTLKQARQALKADMKAVAAQLAELNQQMRGVSDKEKASRERAQRRADRARKRIREDVTQSIAATLQPTIQVKQQLRIGQRTWLAKIHMRPDRTLLASGGCQIASKRLRYSLYALEPEPSDALDTVDADSPLFSLELYDPTTCSQCSSFVFSRLEWLTLTKPHLEQQRLVPELAPPTSDVVKRLVELRESMRETHQALFAMISTGISSKGKASKTKAPPSKKKREELQRAIAMASNEIHRLNREAPWPVLTKALCERCTITPATDSTAFGITLDRCIYRAVSPVLRISSDESEDQEEDESSAVYCRVRADVLPLAKAVVFEVWDPYDRQQWRIAYPESHELLREFEVETFVEQQMHLEAITMSLLLYPNAEAGRLELRFEE